MNNSSNNFPKYFLVFCLILSVVLSVILKGENKTVWDWLGSATPAVIGLSVFVFSKLYAIRDWIVIAISKLKKK